MTLEEIYKNEEISVRSYNVCRYNGLDTIGKLKEYYLKNHSFDNLRNCGRKSNEELIKICEKYEPLILSSTIEQNIPNPLEEIVSNLTRIQREVINNFIIVNTNSLSVRSKNAISIYLKSNFSVRNFAKKIFLVKYFKVGDIEN